MSLYLGGLSTISCNSYDVGGKMKEKIFYIIVTVVCLIGIILTGILVKYTIDLSQNLSITAFISNEE